MTTCSIPALEPPLQEPCGLRLPADSKQMNVAAGRFLRIIQGSVGMKDAAPDGSAVDLGASHHTAFSLKAPFLVTNR